MRPDGIRRGTGYVDSIQFEECMGLCHFPYFLSGSLLSQTLCSLTSTGVYSIEITLYQAFIEYFSGGLNLAEPLYKDDYNQCKQPTWVHHGTMHAKASQQSMQLKNCSALKYADCLSRSPGKHHSSYPPQTFWTPPSHGKFVNRQVQIYLLDTVVAQSLNSRLNNMLSSSLPICLYTRQTSQQSPLQDVWLLHSLSAWKACLILSHSTPGLFAGLSTF